MTIPEPANASGYHFRMRRCVVIGGGFYGCALAEIAARSFEVVIVEREDRILGRASAKNQARIHNGYHYPRSFRTAWRSHTNYARFLAEFAEAVSSNGRSLYAIARHGSKTSASQFERFCQVIGAPLRPARAEDRALFSDALIEEVFEAEEGIFNADHLRASFSERADALGIDLRLGTEVTGVHKDGRKTRIALSHDETLADVVLNCTYSDLNFLGQPDTAKVEGLQHEIVELALVRPPDIFNNLSITVMDGAYWSLLPFPPDGLFSLSHVRYTPHARWKDGSPRRRPTDALRQPGIVSRFESMVRDAARFVPSLEGASHDGSIFEVKTVPALREIDDARPIIVRQAGDGLRMLSVLGSKMDNVFDVAPIVEDFLETSS
ncbi:MAG: FAD-dependent oxidoreductase [Actinomycetota bacterium]